MAKINLRDEMPIVTAWIDDMRAAFGKAYIDSIIREGMQGKPSFFASENGHEVGTRWVKKPEPNIAKNRRELALEQQYAECKAFHSMNKLNHEGKQ